MQAMERWATDVFKPLAMMAHSAAHTLACGGKTLARVIDKPSAAWALTKDVDLTRWVACYESPATFLEGLCQLAKAAGIFDGLELSAELPTLEKSWIRRLFRWHGQIWRGNGYKVERAVDALCERYYREHHLRELHETVDDSAPMPDGLAELFRSAEFVFFLGVVVPCWLRHQTLPWVLVEQAENGDFTAYRNLLEIDPLAEHSARLAGLAFRLSREENKQFLKLQKAKVPKSRKPTTTEDLKLVVTGWLLSMSHAFQDIFSGRLFATIARRIAKPEELPALNAAIKKMKAEAARHPLRSRISAAKARELVNAAAEDAGLGKTDPDFTTAPDSVERQMRRKAKLWPPLWESDNSSAA